MTYTVIRVRLQGILDQVDANKPYVVNALNDRHIPFNAGNKKVIRQRGNAFWFTEPACRVPCTFQSTWLGYVVISYGAMRKMHDFIYQGGLMEVCHTWDVTHDVGLGIMVWEAVIPFLHGKKGLL